MAFIRIFTFALLGMTVFSSCLEDKCTNTSTFVQFDPVYIPVSEIRPGINMEPARELQNPGNIYYYKNYLLVNERREGVHVIDNSDPENPVNLAFIQIPGNLDMAVQDDILYVDLYLDLVAIDIADPLKATILGRTDGVFSSYYPLIEEAGYIVDYVPTERTIEVDCDDWRWNRGVFMNADIAFVNSTMLGNANVGTAMAEATGVGGSMARFSIAKDHLYALDDFRMRVFSMNSGMPDLINTVEVDWGIETLFAYNDYLFIGANAGMFIFDNHDPTSPTLVSEFIHATSCDPVYVVDDIAYVTLRGGNFCQGFTNQLDVIDVSDVENPRLMRSYPMQNPHGLSVMDETLFICEGAFGFKVFDTQDKLSIDENLREHIAGIHGYDVIALDNGNHLIIVGQDGIYQFDATNRSDLEQLSRITVNRI